MAPSLPEVTSAAGGLIWLARHDAGMTQRELAALARVPQSMVSAYEHGRREPTIPTLRRLLRAAGAELRLLLAPADDHDPVLDEVLTGLSVEDRRLWNEGQDHFVAAARQRLESR